MYFQIDTTQKKPPFYSILIEYMYCYLQRICNVKHYCKWIDKQFNKIMSFLDDIDISRGC